MSCALTRVLETAMYDDDLRKFNAAADTTLTQMNLSIRIVPFKASEKSCPPGIPRCRCEHGGKFRVIITDDRGDRQPISLTFWESVWMAQHKVKGVGSYAIIKLLYESTLDRYANYDTIHKMQTFQPDKARAIYRNVNHLSAALKEWFTPTEIENIRNHIRQWG